MLINIKKKKQKKTLNLTFTFLVINEVMVLGSRNTSTGFKKQFLGPRSPIHWVELVSSIWC